MLVAKLDLLFFRWQRMGSVGRKFGDSGSWTGRLVFIVRVLIDCWEPGHFLVAAHQIKKKGKTQGRASAGWAEMDEIYFQ